MKKNITISFDFNFEYDPEGELFKTALKDFNAMMWEANEEQMLQYLASRLSAGDSLGDMIEGIGYVSSPRFSPSEERKPDSGIFVEDEFGEISYL